MCACLSLYFFVECVDLLVKASFCAQGPRFPFFFFFCQFISNEENTHGLTHTHFCPSFHLDCFFSAANVCFFIIFLLRFYNNRRATSSHCLAASADWPGVNWRDPCCLIAPAPSPKASYSSARLPTDTRGQVPRAQCELSVFAQNVKTSQTCSSCPPKKGRSNEGVPYMFRCVGATVACVDILLLRQELLFKCMYARIHTL